MVHDVVQIDVVRMEEKSGAVQMAANGVWRSGRVRHMLSKLATARIGYRTKENQSPPQSCIVV